MRGREISSAPDYTMTCLVMGFINLLWVFCVIWAWLGLPAVLAIGYFLNWLIIRAERSEQR